MTDETDLDDDIALAAEYALGLLTEPEARAFEARLEVDPAFRALYVQWAEDLVSLTDAIPAVPPPPTVQTAITARLFPEEQQSWFRRLGLWPAVFGGLVAALLVLWVTNLGILQPDPATGPRYVAEIVAADQSLIVRASLDAVGGLLQLDRSAGGPQSGRVLELWLIAGDNPPVSLGVLPDAPSAVLIVDAALVPALAGGILAISDEPPGGSATGAPSGDVLAMGPITTL